MEENKSKSRKYKVLLQYKPRSMMYQTFEPILVEGNTSYRNAMEYINKWEKIWSAVSGVEVTRSRAMVEFEQDGRIIRLWFEQER